MEKYERKSRIVYSFRSKLFKTLPVNQYFPPSFEFQFLGREKSWQRANFILTQRMNTFVTNNYNMQKVQRTRSEVDKYYRIFLNKLARRYTT